MILYMCGTCTCHTKVGTPLDHTQLNVIPVSRSNLSKFVHEHVCRYVDHSAICLRIVQDWQPFPKAWLDEGVLVTEKVVEKEEVSVLWCVN